jgi:thiamine biosynthesis lipoprotein
MALTLNGIAQGYVTDRVVGILRAGGIASSLVDMGEIRAIGSGPGGRPWRAGLAAPDKPDAISEALDLVDSAVATSSGKGFNFDRAGLFGHLLDPRSGRANGRYSSVTVIAPTAMEADALSTAFSLMPANEIEQALKRLGRGRAVISTRDGTRFSLSA